MRRLVWWGLAGLVMAAAVLYVWPFLARHGGERACYGRVEFRRPGEPARVAGLRVGVEVNPFAALNFEDGLWTAYLLLDDEYRLSKVRSNRYRLKDPEFLLKLKSAMTTVYTGGDVATVTSSIVFVRNGQPVYETAVVLSGRDLEGFQTTAYGFLEPKVQSSVSAGFLDHFEPVCEEVLAL